MTALPGCTLVVRSGVTVDAMENVRELIDVSLGRLDLECGSGPGTIEFEVYELMDMERSLSRRSGTTRPCGVIEPAWWYGCCRKAFAEVVALDQALNPDAGAEDTGDGPGKGAEGFEEAAENDDRVHLAAVAEEGDGYYIHLGGDTHIRRRTDESVTPPAEEQLEDAYMLRPPYGKTWCGSGPERREEFEKSSSVHGPWGSPRKSPSRQHHAEKTMRAHTGVAVGNCDLAEHLNLPWPKEY
ncbi:hypothetical protein I7I51_07877 [Histoplasma capsulatum]|uniref:Uncharacterized protein n=1 Tax=Ajellomyces capsulatus TaxID=5037 RepID=A0A8A1LXF2_AJECA|nr:hypothetical protein I7I51_07877 [Histoplasma capsulatum]